MTRKKVRAFEFCLAAGREEIRFGFTTRHFPVFLASTRDFEPRIRGARKIPHPWKKNAATAYGLQTHSNRVAEVGKSSGVTPGAFLPFPGTDALLTAAPNLRLVVLSADCLPIFIVAPSAPARIALVHAGWRGTEKGIARAAVRRLARASGTAPRRLFVVFGPALRRCCYEVGPEFLEKFPRSVLTDGRKKPRFDLAAENVRQLRGAGVDPGLILDPGFCTGCRGDLFYSWRREGARAGRMISWIEKRGASDKITQ